MSRAANYPILRKRNVSPPPICPVKYSNNFLPEDGDVLDGTPEGRTILLGGLSPLTLPGVLMAPCLSMGRWGPGQIKVGGLGLPHCPRKCHCGGRELENRGKCPLNQQIISHCSGPDSYMWWFNF